MYILYMRQDLSMAPPETTLKLGVRVSHCLFTVQDIMPGIEKALSHHHHGTCQNSLNSNLLECKMTDQHIARLIVR